jgi:transcriptional regulator with XRE-family HTH domain
MRRRAGMGRSWSFNKLVAYNLRKARLLRGLSQEEAGERLRAYLGKPWSRVLFSAAERSVDGRVGRQRQFSPDDIVAFARVFDVAVGFFFLPPDDEDWEEGSFVSSSGTPDTGIERTDLVRLALRVHGIRERLEKQSYPALAGEIRGYGYRLARAISPRDMRELPRLRGTLEELAALFAKMEKQAGAETVAEIELAVGLSRPEKPEEALGLVAPAEETELGATPGGPRIGNVVWEDERDDEREEQK